VGAGEGRRGGSITEGRGNEVGGERGSLKEGGELGSRGLRFE